MDFNLGEFINGDNVEKLPSDYIHRDIQVKKATCEISFINFNIIMIADILAETTRPLWVRYC